MDVREIATVIADTVGLFKVPSSASAQVGELKKGDKLWLTQPSNGGSWYAVLSAKEGWEGWVESSAVKLETVGVEQIRPPKGGFIASKEPPVFFGVPEGVPGGVPGGVPRASVIPGPFGVPIDDVKPMDWKRYSPEGAQLSIDLPGEPLDMSQVFPSFLKGSKMYATYRKQLVAVVSRLEIPGPVDDTMLTAAFTAMLSKISKGAEVKYEIVSTGNNGTVIHGTTTLYGRAVDVRALLSSKGTSAWMVISLFPQSLAGTLRDAADRIINSVKLEPKPRSAPSILS